MQILKSKYDIGEKEFRLFLIEELAISHMVSEITTIEIVHYQE
jgi:hypothetical protein